MLHWILPYRSFAVHVHALQMRIYLWAEILGHRMCVYLTLVDKGKSVVYSQQKYLRVLIVPLLPQHLFLSVFVITAVLVLVYWHFIVLFCLSLMISDFEPFHMFIVIWISSFMKSLFLIGLYDSYFLSFLVMSSFLCYTCSKYLLTPYLLSLSHDFDE